MFALLSAAPVVHPNVAVEIVFATLEEATTIAMSFAAVDAGRAGVTADAAAVEAPAPAAKNVGIAI